MKRNFQMGVATLTAFAITGCSSMPGNDAQQGAVIGGASGAAVGAAVSKNRALGAVIGGAVGAAGGYVVGKNKDKITGKDDSHDAEKAARKSETDPAKPADVSTATSADLNSDGYVTLDEVVAMEQAGLSDDEMIRRLRATNQLFDLTDEQRQYLIDKGVSRSVVDEMPRMNNSTTNTPTDRVLTREPGTI